MLVVWTAFCSWSWTEDIVTVLSKRADEIDKQMPI